MDEGFNGRSSDHRFQDLPDDAMNLLLNERVSHGLYYVNNGRKKEAVFLDPNERMSTGTIASNKSVRSFDIWYFPSVNEEEMPAILGKVNTYQ